MKTANQKPIQRASIQKISLIVLLSLVFVAVHLTGGIGGEWETAGTGSGLQSSQEPEKASLLAKIKRYHALLENVPAREKMSAGP